MNKIDIKYIDLFIEWGVETEEIKLAGVRAELGNINLTNMYKYIQCKVAGGGFQKRIIVSLVEFRFKGICISNILRILYWNE